MNDLVRPPTSVSLINLGGAEKLAELLSSWTDGIIVLVSINRSAEIRNTLGQEVSGTLLNRLGERLRTMLSGEDRAFQTGPDELAIVRRDPSGIDAYAQRLLDLLSRTYLIAGQLMDTDVNVGVAKIDGDAAALRHARLALAVAIRSGRNRYAVFEPTMDNKAQARRLLEIDLRRALALRELELFYQPQLDLVSGIITGFEALLRWRHPERGLVSPGEFITLAEEIGLIVPMGEWVIRTACREAAAWTAPLGVAVNVSAAQFASPGLVEYVESALRDSGLSPARLEIEITESLFMGDAKESLTILHRLRDMDIRISMDDFGTGYSSLSYLRAFPFDKIKIDQSFVRDEANSRTGSAIVHAVATLGKRLGIATIAEGVETQQQLERIAADGCTAVQGYLVSRPMPAARIAGFLAESDGRFSASTSPGSISRGSP